MIDNGKKRNGGMMKGLFGFLLLLSIIFFAFIRWGGELTGSGKNGTLLGELNPEKIKLLEMSPVKQATVSDIPVAALTVAASAPLAVSIQAASAPPATAQPPAPATTKSPLLLQLHEPVTAAVVKATSVACMEWGEFSGADLERSEKELSKLSLGERLTQRTIEYDSGYWVYIPPLANKAAINKVIAEIKAAGIDEYFILRDSKKWRNAISLGVFKTEAAARNFLAYINKKGLRKAKMGERKHKLKFIVFALKGVNSSEEAKLIELQKDFANSELKKVACSK